MTTDELRAKFEAWYPNAIGDVQPFECYVQGCASRDAEVEMLKKDAKRWRAVRSCVGNVGVYEGTPTYDPGVELLLDEEADQAIDDAMR